MFKGIVTSGTNFVSDVLQWIGITGFQDVVYHPDLKITIKHDVSKSEAVSAFRRREGDAYSDGSLRKNQLQLLVN
jgi:hypothetical protein